MACTIQNNVVPPAAILAEDTEASSTPRKVKDAAGTLYSVSINNTGNTNAVYVKLYDRATAAVGTNDPVWIFECPGSSTRVYMTPTGSAFATKLWMACVTAAGTGGTGSPGSPVILQVTAS